MQNVHPTIRGILSAQIAPPPAQQDYIDLLKHHDWEYRFSGDCLEYRIGKAERLAIEALQPSLDPDFKLWNQFAHHLHRRVPAKVA